MQTIEYTVDDEAQTTTEKVLTPRTILTNAGIDAANHYLVQLLGDKGQKRDSYQDNPDVELHMHPHMRFISVSTGPTTVS